MGECFFDLAYLSTALTLSTIMCVRSPGRYYTMFGGMAILLACGAAFHLFPRFIGLLTDDMNAFWLGLGKLITSVTMTVFCVVLYSIVELYSYLVIYISCSMYVGGVLICILHSTFYDIIIYLFTSTVDNLYMLNSVKFMLNHHIAILLYW